MPLKHLNRQGSLRLSSEKKFEKDLEIVLENFEAFAEKSYKKSKELIKDLSGQYKIVKTILS
jgi:hypothetical protein